MEKIRRGHLQGPAALEHHQHWHDKLPRKMYQKIKGAQQDVEILMAKTLILADVEIEPFISQKCWF